MSNNLELEMEQLRAISASVVEMRSVLSRLEIYRNETIRRLRAEGYSAIKLAKVSELGRAMIYVILDGPRPDADDFEYAELSERIDGGWERALHDWEQTGFDGELEDYFPLEALLGRR